MKTKIEYIEPSFTISKFSINDVISASGGTPCPTGDTCDGHDDEMQQIDPYASCSLVA